MSSTHKKKKQEQLGMNPGTASNKLVKDILFKFIQEKGYKCHQCDKEMTRDNFSIEHIKPWLDSEDPVGLYFDLNNIAFSHFKCNVAARRSNRTSCPSARQYAYGCRCDGCTEANTKKVKLFRERKKNK